MDENATGIRRGGETGAGEVHFVVGAADFGAGAEWAGECAGDRVRVEEPGAGGVAGSGADGG